MTREHLFDGAAVILWPLAMAIAFTGGYVLANQWPHLPPLDADEWLPVAVVPAGLVVALCERLRRRRRMLVVAKMAVAVAVPMILLRPLVGHSLPLGQAIAWWAGLGVLSILLIDTIQYTESSAPGPTLPLALAITTAATGACMVTGGYATLAGPMVAMAITLALGSLLLCITRRLSSKGSSSLTILLLIGSWIIWWFYSEPTPAIVILLFVSLPMILVGQLPFLHHWRPWQVGVFRLVAVAIPALIAVVWSVAMYLGEESYGG